MRRVITAALIAPVVLAIILLGPFWSFCLLVTGVAGLCFYEYGGIAKLSQTDILGGMVVGSALLFVPAEHVFLFLVLAAMLALAFSMRFLALRDALPSAGALILGLLYIYGAWKTSFPLRSLNPYWLVFGLMVNWAGDTGAYYAGRQFGRHKLAPRVSPGKTWEGAAASVAASVLFGVIFLPRAIAGVTVGWAVLLSVAANIAGQFGDLAESALKRGAGVKDSGSILPGHGGMLDRVDSSLFSLPVVWALLSLSSQVVQ